MGTPADGCDAEQLLHRALARAVAFVPGHPFHAGEPDRAMLRLLFTAHSPAEIGDWIGAPAGGVADA